MEKLRFPDLRKHNRSQGYCHPATYVRFSVPRPFDLRHAAVPDNFGRIRLPLFNAGKWPAGPKFAHGVFARMNSGLQAVDILLDVK